MQRTMFTLERKNVDAENLPKETFIIHKTVRYAFMNAQLLKKLTAYNKLIQNNFTLPTDDPGWKFIEENPEFYEDIRGKISQSVLLPLSIGTEYPQQEISHNRKTD